MDHRVAQRHRLHRIFITHVAGGILLIVIGECLRLVPLDDEVPIAQGLPEAPAPLRAQPREQLIDEGLFGPVAPSPEVRRRIGDVVLAAREPVGYVDPDNPGENKLLSGHGSLAPDEMLVPLLAMRGGS